ncbi:MAG: hypothetical protein FWE98_00045 [Oscillospiraceae bacterium]|nr:hypothetical protein [Oscillospiraceae bacterium]
MTTRKVLAVLLCVCAVISVMAIVARSYELPQAVVSFDISALPTTTAPPTTTKSNAQQILDGWEWFKPYFDAIYKFVFQGLSKFLVVAFDLLLAIVGLNLWDGGLFTWLR